MKYLCTLAAVLFALPIISCNGPVNTNKVFADYSPVSKQYKQELAKQITGRNSEAFTYTFNKYLKINGKDYLNINISAKGMKAEGLVLVNNWTKLEGIKRTGGKGYSGAELKNLRLDIDNSGSEPVFVYKGLEKIID